MESVTRDRGPFEACAHCGARFRPETRYPVETRETSDGELELYSFCDQACRRDWLADRD